MIECLDMSESDLLALVVRFEILCMIDYQVLRTIIRILHGWSSVVLQADRHKLGIEVVV